MATTFDNPRSCHLEEPLLFPPNVLHSTSPPPTAPPNIPIIQVNMATDTAKPSSRVAMHIALEIATVEKLKEAILDNAKAIYGPRLGVKDFGIVSVRNPPRVKAPDRSVSDPIRQRYDSVITVSDSAAVPAQSGCSPGDPNDADHMRYCAKLLAYMPDGSAWAMLQSSLPESTLSEALEGLLRMLQWMLSDIL
ncbi:hypothetical protein K458DRAFT_393328 [Lentithecium fluviatile CBS 122367]|uniref:Uncharacterized protein n=1 Tax=Lentithecium fluviatile CBS 122367 TaxID=1168545 RepID=A0A6G1IPI1_9PLEO|nr:hypothetical protein K458DRAFT_393328 [Lentithecium fluviatile CBS 122367]